MWFLKPSLPVEIARGDVARHLKAVGAGALVWLLSALGVLEPMDVLVYDWFQHALSTPSAEPPEVFLVETDPEVGETSARSLIALVEQLRELRAGPIGILSMPRDAGDGALEQLRGTAGVFFGRLAELDPSSPEAPRVVELPPELRGQEARSGAVVIPRAPRGVHREQWGSVEVEGRRLPLLETRIAAAVRGESLDALDSGYRLRFRGGAGGLPRVKASVVLGAGMVPEVVAGRAVLIGAPAGLGGEGIVTPSTLGGRPLSALEFHGQALNTLLSRGEISVLGPWSALLLLLLVAATTWALLQWLDVRVGVWLTVLLLALYAAAAWVLLDHGGVWPPAVELASVQSGLLLYSLKSKATTATEAMTRLLLSSAEAIKDKHVPDRFHESDQHWSLVADMVNQTLDLNRAIFLEAVPGKATLREVVALDAALSDISEKRRDHARPPYLTAREAGAPIRVEQFLKKTHQDEEQFLVPLVHNDELQGFWAFGIEPVKLQGIAGFETLVKEYAGLISELLYQRRQLRERQEADEASESVRRLGRIEQLYRQLSASVRLLGTRLAHTEALLGGVNTATVVYDLFGRVVSINGNMKQILARENLDHQRLTALDLVSAVSEYDSSRSRRILRHVIIEQQTITLPVRLANQGERRFLLYLKPLALSDVEVTVSDASVVGAKCVLCELVDTSLFSGLFEMKEKLTRRLGLQLRNDLASIELSSSLLGGGTLSESQRQNVSQIVHDKVTRMMNVLTECQQYLTLESSVSHVERFPVDIDEHFTTSLGSVRSAFESRGVRLEVERPKVMSYVLASSETVEAIFTTVLRVLLADAVDESTVEVVVTEREDTVRFAFRNTGFGIPDERFQEYIFGDEVMATEELRALREAIRRVEAWGGTLEAHSQVGKGVEVTLDLVKFL